VGEAGGEREREKEEGREEREGMERERERERARERGGGGERETKRERRREKEREGGRESGREGERDLEEHIDCAKIIQQRCSVKVCRIHREREREGWWLHFRV